MCPFYGTPKKGTPNFWKPHLGFGVWGFMACTRAQAFRFSVEGGGEGGGKTAS